MFQDYLLNLVSYRGNSFLFPVKIMCARTRSIDFRCLLKIKDQSGVVTLRNAVVVQLLVSVPCLSYFKIYGLPFPFQLFLFQLLRKAIGRSNSNSQNGRLLRYLFWSARAAHLYFAFSSDTGHLVCVSKAPFNLFVWLSRILRFISQLLVSPARFSSDCASVTELKKLQGQVRSYSSFKVK